MINQLIMVSDKQQWWLPFFYFCCICVLFVFIINPFVFFTTHSMSLWNPKHRHSTKPTQTKLKVTITLQWLWFSLMYLKCLTCLTTEVLQVPSNQRAPNGRNVIVAWLRLHNHNVVWLAGWDIIQQFDLFHILRKSQYSKFQSPTSSWLPFQKANSRVSCQKGPICHA